MTKEQRIKKLIWQLRWMIVKYWCSMLILDIAKILVFILSIVGVVLLICGIITSMGVILILDVIVSIITFKKHRDARNWLGKRLHKFSKWLSAKTSNEGSE